MVGSATTEEPDVHAPRAPREWQAAQGPTRVVRRELRRSMPLPAGLVPAARPGMIGMMSTNKGCFSANATVLSRARCDQQPGCRLEAFSLAYACVLRICAFVRE